MRSAIRVGGFNGVRNVVERGRLLVARAVACAADCVTAYTTATTSVTDDKAKHAAKPLTPRGHNFVKTELQTPHSACRSSQKAVKTPVDAGVLISPRVNILSRACQNASQNFARLIANKNSVARKERSGFRSEGGVVESECGMRFGHFVQRWIYATKRSALVLFLTLSAAAQACIYQGDTTPCPADCIEDGGQTVCIKPVPAASPGGPVERDEQKWLYGNNWYPGRDEEPFYWCVAVGGQIVSNSVPNTCGGLPYGYLGYGKAYFVEGLVFPAASAFANYLYCPYSSSSDSGWGKENFDGAYAAAANAKTKTIGGVEVQSFRRMVFSGATPKKPGGGCDTANPVNVTVDAIRYRDAKCPAGYEQREIGTSIYDANRNVKCAKVQQATCERPEDQCGNPILLSTRAKIQTEIDYPGSSDSLLSLRRIYNSEGFFSADGSLNGAPRNFGRFWRHNYERRIQQVLNSLGVSAIAERADGKLKKFDANGDDLLNFGSAREKLIAMRNAGQLTGWTYTTSADETESYDASGRLVSIKSRNGKKQLFTYSDGTTPLTDAPFAGLLIAVSDDFGRSLRFAYDAKALIRQATNPKGEVFVYGYDTQNNLTQVTSPDQKTRTYVYSEAANTSNELLPNALTGIVDENTNRFSTFTYRGGAAYSTEHAGGVNKYVVSNIYGGIYVWDPLDTSSLLGYPKRSNNFVNRNGVLRLANTFRPSSDGTSTVGSYFSYDAAGNIERIVDYNNNQTCYRFDATRNLETARIEGLTSGADCAASFAAATLAAPARKTTTTWHATYRLPATITEPITGGTKTTTNTYDTNGNLTQRTVTTPQATRTWLWSGYDAYGRATTMTDPRGKITTYAYYPNTAAQNTTLANSRGMLASITNAVGHVTTIAGYNAHGQPLAMTDANGLTTTMTYDARMRLKSRTVSGTGISETTSYDYDGVGQLIKVTLPDASFITYTYDGAHRLTQIQDGQSNKIVYTLDAMGNRTAEQAYDPAGALARSRTRVYDALNRLKQDIGATTPATQISQYGYDNQGNGTTTTDPLSRVTTNAFDALNRLVQVTDPNTPTAGITKYDYDVQDNLTKVTDAKNLNTTYVYNGFNELITQTSPDTGLTTYTYDAAGNMLSKTDARDKVAKYVYDNINRVTQIKYYPTTANANANTSADETVAYTYDSCTNGKGRLCTLSDKSGTTTYSYDLLGRTTAKSQAVASLTQAHSYRYNAAGQMDQLTTASGQVIGYGYSNNRVTSISVNGTALIGSITYDPFGPAVAWLWPSATTQALKTYRDYDLDGRMIRWELKNGVSYIQRDVVWDNVSRVTQLKDLLTPAQANNQGFGYDALDRLTTTNLGTATTAAQILAYDAIGNRTSATINGIISTYNLPTNSHKLTSTVGGTNPRAFTYDAMGNLTFDGKYTNTYLNNGRLNTVTWVTGTAPNTTTNTATYNFNALGQRVRKLAPSNVGGTRRFMYDEAGRIAGEYDASGKLVQETIWLGDLPVATFRPKSGSTTTPVAVDVFYVHADHLGTPRVITRPTDNKVVWKWDSTEAFGNNAVNENPSALGAFTYNLRMPGQYYDKETTTFYNYFRDYDPALGRYVQSDPIGLWGGLNTYGYALQSPLSHIDPDGRIVWLVIPGICAAGGCEALIVATGLAIYMGTDSGKKAVGAAASAIGEMCTPDDREKKCSDLNKIDTDTCRAISRRRSAYAGSACHASASERYAACLRGNPLPPLNTWNN
jgi:RHS repeat-associated protein